jgi:CubicO group peptidase (beta-lactamase class C family)
MIQGASYSVARYGNTFMQGALGPISYRDPTTPLLPTSVNRIASITKVFTTIAIAKLVEDGMIRFDDPVGSILKQFDVPPMFQIQVEGYFLHYPIL